MSRISRTLLFFSLCTVGTLVLTPTQSYSQGVTTSAVTGVVSDSQGAVVPGVTITAVHEPSGTDLHRRDPG